jgi:hypothetical protein
MGDAIFFACFVAVGVLLEWWRADARRPRVERYVSESGMTLLTCRYSFQFFRMNWNTWYRIRALDAQGREHTGLAAATGRIRDTAWVEWD